MFKYGDLIRESSTTTGTGNITLGGALTGYRAFIDDLSENDTCSYLIRHDTLNEFEFGVGTLSAANTLLRTEVRGGSSGTSHVNFSAGSKTVSLVELAKERNIRYGNKIIARDYGVTGDGLDAENWTELNNAINNHPASSVSVVFGNGRFLMPFSGFININRSNVTLELEGSIVDGSQTDPSSESNLIKFNPGTPPWSYTSRAVVADILAGQEAVMLESGGGAIFTVGDWISIVSNIYWTGVSGDSGGGVKYKGEIAQIKYISGDTIYLDSGAKDEYLNAGNIVRVRSMPSQRGCSVYGGIFIGPAGGRDWIGSSNPTGVRGVSFQNNHFGNIVGAKFSDFPRHAITWNSCVDGTVSGCTILGRDLTTPSNITVPPSPDQSPWFTGCTIFDCDGFSFTGNTGRHLRRIFDAETQGGAAAEGSNDGATVCRGLSISGNTVSDSVDGMTTHACERVSFTGNTINNCLDGIGCRGKNVTISGNTIFAHRGIRVGSTDDASYTENLASVGRCVISNNTLHGMPFVSGGIRVRADAESLIVSSNLVYNIYGGHGVELINRNSRHIRISGNYFDLSNREPGGGAGVLVQSDGSAAAEMYTASDMIVSGNDIVGAAHGVRLEGTRMTTPTTRIRIVGNIFSGSTAADVRFGALSGTDIGYFGKDVVVHDNTFSLGYASAVSMLDVRYFERFPAIYDNSYPDAAPLPTGVGTTAPTSVTGATFELGQRFRVAAPAASGWSEYVCTAGGTAGTLQAVTAQMTSGLPTLTLADTRILGIGTYIRVAGAGPGAVNLDARIVGSAGPGHQAVYTLDTNAGTTVASAAVTYRNPTWKGLGAVQA